MSDWRRPVRRTRALTPTATLGVLLAIVVVCARGTVAEWIDGRDTPAGGSDPSRNDTLSSFEHGVQGHRGETGTVTGDESTDAEGVACRGLVNEDTCLEECDCEWCPEDALDHGCYNIVDVKGAPLAAVATVGKMEKDTTHLTGECKNGHPVRRGGAWQCYTAHIVWLSALIVCSTVALCVGAGAVLWFLWPRCKRWIQRARDRSLRDPLMPEGGDDDDDDPLGTVHPDTRNPSFYHALAERMRWNRSIPFAA